MQCVFQESKAQLMENFKTVERQLNDEADRVKSEIQKDADQLRQGLTIDKARQAKHLDTAADALRTQTGRLQATIARCQVQTPRRIVLAYSSLLCLGQLSLPSLWGW